ncbi:hypothetical protein HBN50_00945 [Halobacteriovorax sp. GB3]|uniref:hypothetical protein n=1 Tax=Halobacteriovorax sp. GB3 TaxID=2719615 RepID=UPI00235FC0CE|nr:hypothetical protein [Halobacteriovorax sp. GB3]MDD0851633.1 hypothetical protein [Halobacteriovorax sp. GB3]
MKKALLALGLLVSISSFADTYTCYVYGSFESMDGEVAKVDAKDIQVTVDANRSVLFGREEEPQFDGDTRPETMPWSLSIRNKRDGGLNPLVLSLGAPNQNSRIAYAYAEAGSKYIGLIYNDDIEALCIKN